MDFSPARPPAVQSPTTGTVRTRPPPPMGPRNPKSTQKAAVVPVDLGKTMLEEATPAYSSPRVSTWTPSQDAASESGSSRQSTSSTHFRHGTAGGDPPPARIPTPASPAVKIIRKIPTLILPPSVNFDSTPVLWRGMTLQAAQWSLTSKQLQEIVSTAIKASAQESFIRLMPLHVLEGEIAEEVTRLESLRAKMQAQYRFNMQRRMMLLQSLNVLSFADSTDAGDREALANMTTQLSEVTAACDRLMETLLTISDQRAQIQRIQDVHTASALAMALRKLNASYGKRAVELKEARSKISELQEELEEAWQVAEEMAQEMDDLDNFDFGYPDEQYDDVSAVVGDAFTERSVLVGDSVTERSVQLAQVVGVTATAVASKATYANVQYNQPPPPVADRVNRVQAARRRSVRTSRASLRIARTPSASGERPSGPLRRAQSRSHSVRRAASSSEGVPRVPIIHIDTVGYKGGSFLELSETRPTTPATAAAVSPTLPPPLPQFAPKRNTLEVPAPSPNPTIPSPGFDRTIIPPLIMHRSKDDMDYQTLHERQQASRRVKSLQPRSRTNPLPDDLSNALRGTTSERRRLDWSMAERPKPRRYSVPVKAARLTSQPVQAQARDAVGQPAAAP
ncbi:uncharacterized protein LAESUDRAFT_812328 [Laetiporus sulphureus 93-53]|uniref:Uncharacterized protein n=1 Tax=Laetiporus sulphureus 93-53 TaxID=1314785 RepID=A0A165EM63_9APHY|nr:uncharacterized protein LAESUDRAFT_812328 [Laetiporus sulphureus 93-53]KZT07348.1 hypothetical protein LAESUDRAFT_812328 [Laetiporus sulphureus 93-53]